MRYLNNSFITNAKGKPIIPVQYYPPLEFISPQWHIYDANANKHYYERMVRSHEQVVASYRVPAKDVTPGKEINNWHLNNLSYTLYYFDEPILYNAYLSKTVYRIYSEAGLMNFDYVIDVVKESDSQYIDLKILKGRLPFIHSNTLDSLGRIIPPNAHVPVYIYHQPITTGQFKRIKYLIDSTGFVNMPSTPKESAAMDVSFLTVEVHNKQGYKFVARWMDGEQEVGLKSIVTEIKMLCDFYEHEQKVVREFSRRERENSER
ncbi:MAG: hypothetical protein EOO43_04740 [Flavobacterium sp.]|nr:MAG: hypothetical protein EOO43_04740 [Flavobacterium sp.]